MSSLLLDDVSSFNRTIVELKRTSVQLAEPCRAAFNRTIVELKRNDGGERLTGLSLLIVP